ncbi:MAG: cell division ATP-binding protein FtsE [Pseudomonadales bacterium]|nr:cell division ATP-binding protein FtsE [Pseudomonadales bacterium]
MAELSGHISLQRVTRRFDNGHEALADVSVDFPEGSMTFLTGHSGAGKSTFLKLLLRADLPSRGRILVNDIDIAKLPDKRLPRYRQHIGVVFQDHHLLAQRTVFDNVALPLRVVAMREREVGRRVRAALSQVELAAKENLYPRHLSTGEQQRVGIARAVVTRPKILLADEPTGNLDPDLSIHIMELFARFNQVGTTVIIASHDIHLITAMGFRTLRLEQGRVVQDTPAARGASAQAGSGD